MAKTLRKKAINQILYISIGSVIGIIILFVILYNVFNSNIKKNNIKMGEENSNSEASSIEQANSQVGKSIDEVQDETSANSLSIELSQNNEDIQDVTLAESTANNTTQNVPENSSKNEIVENQKTDKNNTVAENSNQENKIEDGEVASGPTSNASKEPDPVFVMPVDGEIVKQYAKDKLLYSNTLKEWTTHLGIDIKANKTTVVKASTEGVVKAIKNDPRYGLTIIIEHSNGFTSVYSNLLSAEFVTIGEQVKSGQTIGTVGNSATFEIVDEPHLHFEITKDGVNVDPEMCIKGM